MDIKEFEITSWGNMDDQERAAWLSIFVLRRNYESEDSSFTVGGKRPVLDHNLIAACEQHISGETFDLYLKNCLSEASALAYEGMSHEEVTRPQTAYKFYSTLMMLPLESRARSLFWAHKGEGV